MIGFKEFLHDLESKREIRVVISVDQSQIDTKKFHIITEAKKTAVGRDIAYKHQPHFDGGEYHGHCDLDNGCQVAWTITGKRLHPNKFPANGKIPNNAKKAVAKVLGVSLSILEGYIAYDSIDDEKILLFELIE